MKKTTKIAITIFAALFPLTGPMTAQPDGPTGPDCWPAPCVPIDNGIIYLVVAAIALGFIVIRKNNIKNHI